MNKGFSKYFKKIDSFNVVLIVLYIFLNLVFSNIYAQIPTKQKSVLALSGGSKNINLKGNKMYIRQSIGQNGISGTSKKNNLILIQGFIFPQISVTAIKEYSDLDVEIKLLPNSNIYNVFIKAGVINDFNINLFSLQGKTIYFNHVKNNQFTINLNQFPKGIYILSIHSSSKYFATKLIKY